MVFGIDKEIFVLRARSVPSRRYGVVIEQHIGGSPYIVLDTALPKGRHQQTDLLGQHYMRVRHAPVANRGFAQPSEMTQIVSGDMETPLSIVASLRTLRLKVHDFLRQIRGMRTQIAQTRRRWA